MGCFGTKMVDFGVICEHFYIKPGSLFGAKNGSKRPKIAPKRGQKWAKNRSKIGHFGWIWIIFGSIRGHFWGQTEIILASVRHHFGSLGVVLTGFWVLLTHFLAFSHLYFLDHLWALFGIWYLIFLMALLFGVWKLSAILSKMMQGKTKICKFLPKSSKIMQNCAKTSLFSPTKHLFCLKTAKIDVSTYENVQ